MPLYQGKAEQCQRDKNRGRVARPQSYALAAVVMPFDVMPVVPMAPTVSIVIAVIGVDRRRVIVDIRIAGVRSVIRIRVRIPIRMRRRHESPRSDEDPDPNRGV